MVTHRELHVKLGKVVLFYPYYFYWWRLIALRGIYVTVRLFLPSPSVAMSWLLS